MATTGAGRCRPPHMPFPNRLMASEKRIKSSGICIVRDVPNFPARPRFYPPIFFRLRHRNEIGVGCDQDSVLSPNDYLSCNKLPMCIACGIMPQAGFYKIAEAAEFS
jgi:hypothetical protein